MHIELLIRIVVTSLTNTGKQQIKMWSFKKFAFSFFFADIINNESIGHK